MPLTWTVDSAQKTVVRGRWDAGERHISVRRGCGYTRILPFLFQDGVPWVGISSAGFQAERVAHECVQFYLRTFRRRCLPLLICVREVQRWNADQRCTFSLATLVRGRREIAPKLSNLSNGRRATFIELPSAQAPG
jgi:hypothetical protein